MGTLKGAGGTTAAAPVSAQALEGACYLARLCSASPCSVASGAFFLDIRRKPDSFALGPLEKSLADTCVRQGIHMIDDLMKGSS